ncbi:MAG: site-specific integrase, partial [Bacteroidetes bacterium]|nr:site-specific integrase [Bacteroidota bacterium]
KELDEIYNAYPSNSYNYEEKLMLSLIIYQGITREEILKLIIKSINLEKGQIEIPGTNLRNSRILNLESHQVIPFYNHTEHKKEEGEEILFTKCKTHWVHSKFLTLIHKNLKKQNIKLNLKQLRQSRYSIIIRKHGLRLGQYMSGFKSIKTAERYRKKDITDLKASIAKYHPLNEV